MLYDTKVPELDAEPTLYQTTLTFLLFLQVGAKTIAFFPIFDENQDRWSSGMFVWCTSPLRYFDQVEDLTYLASWSHSILAELGRLQTLASDKAKGSFISSVSHELR
jgi:signal transduction histidine kinase